MTIAIGGAPRAREASRADTPAQRAETAQRFEALIVREMVKAMRGAELAPGLFDSAAGRAFRDQQDQLMAESLAVAAPLGVVRTLGDAR